MKKSVLTFAGVVALLGCREKESSTQKSPTAAASVSAAACDVTVVPSERIGNEALGTAQSKHVSIAGEPLDKTYCFLGITLKHSDTLREVEPRLKPLCDWKMEVLYGATTLHCKEQGIGLVFGGIEGVFDGIEIFPKGALPRP